MFRATEHHTQYINWGDLAVRGQLLLGGLSRHWSVGGEQWVRVVNPSDIVNPNDIGVLFLSFSFYYSVLLYSVIKLFLPQPMGFTFS